MNISILYVSVTKYLHILMNILESWRHYLETDPDPIAMVIRVELFTHRPSERNRKWHCMVTHARLCCRCLLFVGLVDE